MHRPTPAPYGPNTRAVRRFLQRLAALDAAQWAEAAERFAALERTARFARADRALAEAVTRTDRVRERDAVLGPLLQIVGPSADAAADAAAEPHPVAAPALGAALALVMRDVLDEDAFAALWAPFAPLLPLEAG